MPAYEKELLFSKNTSFSPSLQKKRCCRKRKVLQKAELEMFSNDYSLEIARSTFEDEVDVEGDMDNDPNKRYKTRDEISFLEQQLIKDPSWSRKTVQLCKRTLRMRADQIYKWGYDRKKAMKRYSTLYPESNGIKARFAQANKEVDKSNMNGIVDSIIDSMKYYKIYDKSIEEESDDDDSDIENQAVIFHFDEANESQIWQSKELDKSEYFSEPLGLNEFSMRLNTFDWFNEELYLNLSRDNNFY